MAAKASSHWLIDMDCESFPSFAFIDITLVACNWLWGGGGGFIPARPTGTVSQSCSVPREPVLSFISSPLGLKEIPGVL